MWENVKTQWRLEKRTEEDGETVCVNPEDREGSSVLTGCPTKANRKSEGGETMGFQLTGEQKAAVENRGGQLLVSAAAGSGKTRVLVERLLGRVEEGCDIDAFLIITYTKAAAAELKSRIAAEISDRLALHPEDARLRRQATLVYKADISTIDSFCTRFLREEGHRLDLDYDFRVCDENEAQVLLEEALSEVLEERYRAVEGESDFTRLVDTMSDGRDDSRLVQMVMDIRRGIQSHPDPDGWLRKQEQVFSLGGISDVGETEWGRVLLEDVGRQAEYWTGRMLEALEICQGDPVLAKAYAPSVQATFNSLLALSQTVAKGWDATGEKVAQVDFPRAGSSKGCEDQNALKRVQNLRKQCQNRAKKMGELFGAGNDSAGLIEDMKVVYPAVRGLFSLVCDLESAFSEKKRCRGVLDFSDLEHLTARLLVEENGVPTELANRWSARYTEVMVDEFQDVNAVQNAIFAALSYCGSKLFAVGDVKQSIYRFRLADPAIFLEKYRNFRSYDHSEDGEPRKVLLSQNFRSRPQILEACNYLFRSIMSIPFGEMEYTEEEALRPRDSGFPGREEDYALELDLLDCSSAGEDEDGGSKPSKALLEARFAADKIRMLLDEGFPVTDGEGGLRPVKEGDIVILLRSPGPVLPYYAVALEEQGIRWEAEGSGDFFGRSEIQVALSFLEIIDNLRQDVPLIAVLRSPVWGFSADRLSQIRASAFGRDFYEALLRDDGEDVKEFLAEINELRSHAGEESCDRFIWRLYDRTNLLGIYANMEDGETSRTNLLLLVQMARNFEVSGHKGLFGFLTYLRRLEEAGKSPVLPQTGGSGGVRIMSIHRSKGLEFPVVLLSGLSHQPNKSDARRPMLFHAELGVGPKRLDLERMVEYPTLARLAVAKKLDQEQCAEELRLLYVGMTRAKDKLILSCALTRGQGEIEKLLPQAGAPVEPQALLDSQNPAQWVLLAALARPEARSLWEDEFLPAVRPGTDFGAKWDIFWVNGVDFGVKPLRKTVKKNIQAQKEQMVGEELLDRFIWRYPHMEDVDIPSKLTATQLKGRNLDQEAAEEAGAEGSGKVEKKLVRFDRPRFAVERLGLTPTQKGTALHLVMQYIDFEACGTLQGVQTEIARLEERRFLTPQQAQSVDPERIWQFFASPLGQEVALTPTLRREFKFSLLVPARRYYPKAGEEEQVLLQGVVDCYFENEDGITVVDFKTDHVKGDALTIRAAEYAPQLNAYGEALQEITGKPVVRKVLWFFSEGRQVEV